MPTVTWTFGATPPNASAAAVASGPTVDEPSASIEPDRLDRSVDAPPAAPVSAGAEVSAGVVVSELPESLLPPHPAATDGEERGGKYDKEKHMSLAKSHSSPFPLFHSRRVGLSASPCSPWAQMW